MSKDVKPKQRIGQRSSPKKKILTWSILLFACTGGVFAAYHYGTTTTKVDVPVVKARRAEYQERGDRVQ